MYVCWSPNGFRSQWVQVPIDSSPNGVDRVGFPMGSSPSELSPSEFQSQRVPVPASSSPESIDLMERLPKCVTPPQLVRQCAWNPSLQPSPLQLSPRNPNPLDSSPMQQSLSQPSLLDMPSLDLNRLELTPDSDPPDTELTRIALDAQRHLRDLQNRAQRFAQWGLADHDCASKWLTSLQELLHTQDLILLSDYTRRWYNSNKYKTLHQLGITPLRFPVRLLMSSNNTLHVEQRAVDTSNPDWGHFAPV